jgi:hypothetical protein
MKIKTFTFFINEDLNQKAESNQSSDDMKSDIYDMIEKSLNSSDVKTKEEFVSAYLKDQEKNQIEGFINDSDVYEFYLKHRNTIDDVLSKSDFFNEKPADLDSFSLYDYVIVGTKKAVMKVLNNSNK